MLPTNDFEELLVSRIVCYGFLCKTFREEIDCETLDLAGQPTLLDAMTMWGNDSVFIDLTRLLPQLSLNADEELLDNLRLDYTRLFLGPKRLPAPIWESAARGSENELYTAHTRSVREFYCKNGFDSTFAKRLVDDHVAVEMEFMCSLANAAYLAYADNCEATMRNALRESYRFLHTHLNRWLSLCAQRMQPIKTHSRFYPSLMLWASQFASCDEKWLGEQGFS